MARRSSSRLVSAGLLILSILLLIFVWQPMQDDLETLSDDLDAKSAQLDSLQNELASLVNLEDNLPVAETERERILAAVPVGLQQDALVEDLDAIAREVGISLNSINFSLQNEDVAGSNVVAITANFTGSYGDLIGLLQAFETNERIFKVTSIGVQLGEVTEDSGYSMVFNVSLEAYYQD